MGNGNRPTPEFRREAARPALTGGRTRRENAVLKQEGLVAEHPSAQPGLSGISSEASP